MGAAAEAQRTTRARGGRAQNKRVPPPIEHRILVSLTLCLLAFGAVMVYSASSPLGVLSAGGGTGTGEFLRYLLFGALGLLAMHVLSRRGLQLLNGRLVSMLLIGSFALLLLGSFFLLLLVLVPGFGVQVNGALRWFAAVPIQFQPA